MKQNIIDAKEFKEPAIQLNGLNGLDIDYTFYYDETNNIRKFYLKKDGFNTFLDSNFVLGGVLHQSNTEVNLTELFSALRLQKTTTELKLKHLAQGDFISCLKSKKLNTLLNWLYESKLFIHYTNLNFFYYSLVDIVDSAIFNNNEVLRLGLPFINMLKNDLYKIALFEKDLITDLLHRCEYPNIKSGKVRYFIEELFNIFIKYEEDPEYHVGLTSLKQILKESIKRDSLPFLKDEEDFVLLKNFFHFYIYPLYMFTNSTHIFDKENTIEKSISSVQIVDEGRIVNSYKFVDSVDNQFVQISDVFTGLFGKYTGFINSTDKSEFEKIIRRLKPIEIDTFVWFQNNILKANGKNQAFLHSVCSINEMQKEEIIIELLFKYSL